MQTMGHIFANSGHGRELTHGRISFHQCNCLRCDALGVNRPSGAQTGTTGQPILIPYKIAPPPNPTYTSSLGQLFDFWAQQTLVALAKRLIFKIPQYTVNFAWELSTNMQGMLLSSD